MICAICVCALNRNGWLYWQCVLLLCIPPCFRCSSVLDAWPSWLPFLSVYLFCPGIWHKFERSCSSSWTNQLLQIHNVLCCTVCLVFLLKMHPKIQKKGSTSIIFSLFIGMQLMDEVIFFLCVFLCAPMGKLLHFKPGFHSLWWDTVGFKWIRHLFCWLFQHALRIMWENQLWEEEELFNHAVPLFLSV